MAGADVSTWVDREINHWHDAVTETATPDDKAYATLMASTGAPSATSEVEWKTWCPLAS